MKIMGGLHSTKKLNMSLFIYSNNLFKNSYKIKRNKNFFAALIIIKHLSSLIRDNIAAKLILRLELNVFLHLGLQQRK